MPKSLEDRQAEIRDQLTLNRKKPPKPPNLKQKAKKSYNRAQSKKTNRKISTYKRKIKVLSDRFVKEELKTGIDPSKTTPMFLPVWGAEALELYILGEPVEIIAKRVTQKEEKIKSLLESPEGKSYLQKACQLIDIGKVRDQFRGMWHESMGILQEVMRSSDPDYKQTRVKIAQWFVEISGVKVPEEVKHKHEHVFKGVAQIIHETAQKKEKEIKNQVHEDVPEIEFETVGGNGKH